MSAAVAAPEKTPAKSFREVWLISLGHGLTHWYPSTFYLLLPIIGRELSLSYTQIGLGYIDGCLILALNYITSYAYSGSVSVNHTYMMQVSLRTLGGTTNTGAAGTGLGGGAFGSTH